MRRWLVAPLAFAAIIGLATQDLPRAAGQKEKDKKDGPSLESFFTADGVELRGLFHQAQNVKNPKDAPVVVFLYPPGPDRDMTKGDWGGLAEKLNKEGFHVFQFDWRGHGRSTNIKDTQKFWGNGYLNGKGSPNSLIKGGPPKMPLKNELLIAKDVAANQQERFMPAYLTDLAAVRLYLDIKNDKGDLNSSSIFVVGAGDTATLGLAWLTIEWNRPADMPNAGALGLNVGGYEYVPQPLNGGIKTEAGQDFAGCAWLTPSRPSSFSERTIKAWVSNRNMAPKLRENNPMLFLYADKDNRGRDEARFFYNDVLVASPPGGSPLNKLDQTFIKDVPGAAQLTGVKLLGEAAVTNNILKFFEASKKQRANLPWKSRDFKSPYYINLAAFSGR